MIIEQSCDMARCGGLEPALALVRSHISHTASLIWCVHPRRLFQIEKYAAEHSEMEWIVGGGWDMSWFPDGLSLASVLDRVMPDRPAVFRRVDGHAVVSYHHHHHHPTPLVLSPSRAISPTHRTHATQWANTAAMKAIDVYHKDFPDPPHGRIDKDSHTGLPIGSFQEQVRSLRLRSLSPTTSH
jgi:predicted amidohydrolase YtcJ